MKWNPIYNDGVYMKEFEFTIDGNWLYVGDDAIRLDLIKKLCVENSCVDGKKYAIHLHTYNMIMELYYKSRDKIIVENACQDLLDAIQLARESEHSV